MSTAPVTPAAPKETVGQKIETVFTDIAKVFQGGLNAIVNVSAAEQPFLQQVLPANIYTPYMAAVSLAQKGLASIEAQEPAIGAQPIPYAEKVAKVIGLWGPEIALFLAQAGLENNAAALQTVVLGATSLGNIGKVTAPPTPPPAVPGTGGVPAA
jgi:hypothetical protein